MLIVTLVQRVKVSNIIVVEMCPALTFAMGQG